MLTMTFFGNPLSMPRRTEFFRSACFSLGVALICFFSGFSAQIIVSWSLAVSVGYLLSSAGVRTRGSFKNSVIVMVATFIILLAINVIFLVVQSH
jgi:hypothetical protein